jgi:DNA-binding NarL/FixJ family response regulator
MRDKATIEARRREWAIPIKPHPALTRRQNELAVLLCDGLTAPALAEALGVQPATVALMLRRMAQRLDVPKSVAHRRVVIVRHLLAYSMELEEERAA